MLQCVFVNSAGCNSTQSAIIDQALQQKIDIATELSCPTNIRSPCVEVDDCVCIKFYLYADHSRELLNVSLTSCRWTFYFYSLDWIVFYLWFMGWWNLVCPSFWLSVCLSVTHSIHQEFALEICVQVISNIVSYIIMSCGIGCFHHLVLLVWTCTGKVDIMFVLWKYCMQRI